MNVLETKIRTKIDKVFIKYAPSEELTELKEELIADLSEIAQDNINNNQAEDEAVESAFVHLGDIDELMAEFDEARKEETQEESKSADNIVKIGKFVIDDSKISYDNKVIIDENRVDFGSFLKVEDGSVDMGNGFFRVNDDGVSLGKEKIGNIFSRLKLVNNVQYDLSQINEVTINYKNDHIELKQSPNNQLIVKEYMSRNNDRYNLTSNSTGDGQLYIKQGDRPIMWHIHSRIEIFVPQKYAGKINVLNRNGSMFITDLNNELKLSVTASNGAISVENAVLTKLNLFCANGAIKVNNLTVSEANLISNNGSITGSNLTGEYTIKTRNGAIKTSMINGSGSFSSNNGSVKVDFNKVTGDINTYTKNGSIRLMIPEDSSVEFSLQSKMGIVKNKLSGAKMKVEAQGFIEGICIDNPQYKLVGKSDHGTVRLG
ncbi:hypothetical protein RD055328_05540 [Companilactobacillus sp. RD055328]|uniref:DUF4097 family beta strand repeat-containing protein n=1 Tax=Companilactobacillus sp. RD055328 TaxID=2916634 RepID=UPI001FC8200B|nr:DUF4097 family beta strand repeat-containing protein [Companilactobacillus sp. RD055328]GKQ42631.1 hypothetical protein RD055328_05540 [Companilactobacillus sp. RD055328]